MIELHFLWQSRHAADASFKGGPEFVDQPILFADVHESILGFEVAEMDDGVDGVKMVGNVGQLFLEFV